MEEELLEFDEQGNLANVIKPAKEKRREGNLIQLDMGFGEPSLKSESFYQGQNNTGQHLLEHSSVYSQSVPPDPYDDQTSVNVPTTLYNEPTPSIPVYTKDDLRRMKSDYKELKQLIKQTKRDIKAAMENGQEVGEL